MQYNSIIVTRRGTPEVLRLIKNDLRDPLPGEARVRVSAAGVCGPDITARYGQTPFPPRIPFVPGYSITGIVDAVGKGITRVTAGDRVAALTVRGGYAEYVYLPEKKLVPHPVDLDPVAAVTLMLNYTVAYQVMYRKARVKSGDRVLIIGASGGVGTAFLQLGRLAGLNMYGVASPSKHSLLIEYGAKPIDYHKQDFIGVIRQTEPEGLDYVFDGMVHGYLDRGFGLLRRGGCWVQYGNPITYSGLLSLFSRVILYNVLPNGRTLKLYGNSSYVNQRIYLEDWAVLFKMLQEGKIKPIIAAKFPLVEAPRANELLESGQVSGNIVLVAPELL